MDHSTPGLPVHHQLPESPKPMSIESVMSSNSLIFYRPLLLSPSIFPSIRDFSNESVLHMRWPKYWSFSFSISSFNGYSGLIFFRMNWLDLFAAQGTLKRFLQHHSAKASILWHSAFFTVQLSHLYMTTGKTIALSRQNFVGKVMSLLFSMLSRLVITFLTRSKWLLISWFQSPSAVILEPPKMKWLRVGHDWATSLSLFTFMHWRRKWQPTPVFLPGESQGRGSLVGFRLWGHTESDTTEAT